MEGERKQRERENSTKDKKILKGLQVDSSLERLRNKGEGKNPEGPPKIS
jgi:hypothetical protein